MILGSAVAVQEFWSEFLVLKDVSTANNMRADNYLGDAWTLATTSIENTSVHLDMS